MTVLISLLLAVAVPAVEDGKKDRQALLLPGDRVPPGKLSSADPSTIAAFLQKEGYRAKLITDDGERPYIESAANGAKFYIYPQNCDGESGVCEDLMFRSSYDKRPENPVNVDKMNEFNRDVRWARAYLDQTGNPVVELDVLFTDRLVDEKMFGEALAIWGSTLSQFHEAIDW
jgi:hypothetical protein